MVQTYPLLSLRISQTSAIHNDQFLGIFLTTIALVHEITSLSLLKKCLLLQYSQCGHTHFVLLDKNEMGIVPVNMYILSFPSFGKI